VASKPAQTQSHRIDCLRLSPSRFHVAAITTSQNGEQHSIAVLSVDGRERVEVLRTTEAIRDLQWIPNADGLSWLAPKKSKAARNGAGTLSTVSSFRSSTVRSIESGRDVRAYAWSIEGRFVAIACMKDVEVPASR